MKFRHVCCGNHHIFESTGKLSSALWYYQQPQHCVSCFQYGHVADLCPNYKGYAAEFPPIQNDASPISDATNAAAESSTSAGSGQSPRSRGEVVGPNNVSVAEVVGGDFDAEVFAQKYLPKFVYVDAIPESERQSFLACKQLAAAIKYNKGRESGHIEKTTFSSGDPVQMNQTFSHLKRCPGKIRIWGNNYDTVENFMGDIRARLLGDPKLAENLKRCPRPGQISGLSTPLREKIPPVLYAMLTAELLIIGNKHKFSHYSYFRKLLFERRGVLVEANTGANIWSCGLRSGDPKVQDYTAWPKGCFNLAGIILEYVREHLGRTAFAKEFTNSFSYQLRRGLSQENLRPRPGSFGATGSIIADSIVHQRRGSAKRSLLDISGIDCDA